MYFRYITAAMFGCVVGLGASSLPWAIAIYAIVILHLFITLFESRQEWEEEKNEVK